MSLVWSTSVAFLSSHSRDDTVRVWDVETAAALHVLPCRYRESYDEPCPLLRSSGLLGLPSAQFVVMSSAGQILIHDTAKGQVSELGPELCVAAFTSAGPTLIGAARSNETQSLKVWNLRPLLGQPGESSNENGELAAPSISMEAPQVRISIYLLNTYH